MAKTSTNLDYPDAKSRKMALATAVREHASRQSPNRLIDKIVSGKLRGAVSMEGAVEFWEGRGKEQERGHEIGWIDEWRAG